MCDYSIRSIASRPAVVGESLITRHFGTGTTGFGPENGEEVAICVLPGTEIAFDGEIFAQCFGHPRFYPPSFRPMGINVGRFRQVNKDQPYTHHDALELPDGEVILLTWLQLGQRATVLQLPAVPKTAEEAEEQKRLEIA